LFSVKIDFFSFKTKFPYLIDIQHVVIARMRGLSIYFQTVRKRKFEKNLLEKFLRLKKGCYNRVYQNGDEITSRKDIQRNKKFRYTD